MKNNDKIINKIFISIICLAIYHFINTFFLDDYNNKEYIITLIPIGIFIFINVNKLINNDIYKFNENYFKFLNISRGINAFFGDGSASLAYFETDETIKEGNTYIKNSKIMFLIINFGILTILFGIQHIILNSPILQLSLFSLILVLLIFLNLIILPILIPFLIIKNKESKIKVEQRKGNFINKLNKTIITELIIFAIFNVIYVIKIGIINLLVFDTAIIILMALIYWIVKEILIKQYQRKIKSEQEKNINNNC